MLILRCFGIYFKRQCKRNSKKSSFTSIDYKMLQKMLRECNEVEIIDVRSKQEFSEGHLKNAKVIPIFEFYKSAQQILNDKNKTIIIYCKSGIKSKRAAEFLVKNGYKNVYELDGGLDNI